jgi:hypothetical protein
MIDAFVHEPLLAGCGKTRKNPPPLATRGRLGCLESKRS